MTETSRLTPSLLVTQTRTCASRRSSRAILPGRPSTGNGSPSAVRGAKLSASVVDIDLAHLGERSSDHRFRSLVVEDRVAVLVRDERRRREVRGELAGEDQDQMLLRHPLTVRRQARVDRDIRPLALFEVDRAEHALAYEAGPLGDPDRRLVLDLDSQLDSLEAQLLQ